jgi:hypothetical protein
MDNLFTSMDPIDGRLPGARALKVIRYQYFCLYVNYFLDKIEKYNYYLLYLK